MYDVLEVSRHIINYSNDNNIYISNLKLQKLLYFVQAQFLTSSVSRVCFKEKIYAWPFGPVVLEAYNEYKQYGGNYIPKIYTYFIIPPDNVWGLKKMDFLDDVITQSDKLEIDYVVDLFAEMSPVDMTDLTLRQAPWRKSYFPKTTNEIPCELIKDYFKDV